MTPSPAALVEVIRAHGYERRDEPFLLASGELSHDFIDGKAALARGRDLHAACTAMAEAVEGLGVVYDVVGGLTMGADQFAHGIAILTDRRWFVVRKEPKGRGTDRLVEGARLGDGARALVVEDVTTTGGSLLRAVDAVEAEGARVVAAATLVDRGNRARRLLTERRIPFVALVTYRDLAIDAVGGS